MPDATTMVFVGLTVVLQLAIATVLVRKYLRTRDVGFVWLGVAVVIWPLVLQLLNIGEHSAIDRYLSGHLTGFFPFTLIERGQATMADLIRSFVFLRSLVGTVLLLIAVLYLRRNGDRQIGY